MGKLGVDPRGWRGVIDRPGREDFKVSETSQAPCDSEAQREGRRDGGKGEAAGECRNKSTTLNLASAAGR